MKKFCRVMAAFLALSMSLTLSACSKGSSSSAVSLPENQEEIELGQSDIKATDTVADSVSIALANDDVEFSPWSGNQGGRGNNIWLIYQPLVWLVDGEMTNCLIESYEKIDDTTVTVTLYDYIKDSAGNPITASDVVFSYTKAKEEGAVKGASYFDTVTATGDYTVQFTFSRALALGELEQTFSQVYIVSEKSYEESGDGMLLNPIGTGRYVLSNYESGSSITFKENEDYWQTNEDLVTVRDVANVKEITYYIITEATQRAIAVEEGTVDFADISVADLESVTAAGKSVYKYQNTLTYYMAANCSEDSVLQNEALRKAVFYAIDSSQLAAGLTSTSGFPVYDMMCSNYVDYLDSFETEDNFYTNASLETAAKYLEEAGYEPGEVTLTLIGDSSQVVQDLSVLLQAILEQVGIKVEVELYQSNIISTYTSDSAAWDLYIEQKADNLYMVNAWANVLDKDKYEWGGTVNFVFDDTLQEMLDVARTEETHTEENILALHDYIVDKAYLRGLTGYYSMYAYSDAFSGVYFNEKGFVAPNCCVYNAE